MESFLESVAGLPTHPLVVHAAVVLLPLSAVGAVLVALRRALSRRYASLVVVVAAVGVGAAFLARTTGERLALQVGVPAQHAEWGDLLPWVALGYVVVLVVFWLVDRGIPTNRARPWWVVALAVLLVIAAVAVTWLTVLTGHSGAQAVWG